MSQSPLEEVGRREAGGYLEAIDRWSRLVQAGNSHSGREKNRAFLNLDGAGFAAISAVSGLDFADDARAVVPVDWDHDGDLDLWLSNRTAPQLRLMRNAGTGDNHAVALQLVGTSVNRDAIGARIDLSHDGIVRTRTLKAGAGFLSQGSKWIHVGLGQATRIDRVAVRWPGAETETFDGVAPDGRYRLVQGTGRAVPVAVRETPARLSSSPPATPEARGTAGIRLASRPPAPRIHYSDWKGAARDWAPGAGRPRLLNLWASWCAPCAGELTELTRRRREFEEHDLEILALSVDGLGDDRGGDPEKFLRDLDVPFAAGAAEAATVHKFELLFTRLFGRHVSLPVPASFLIDGEGNLAAIYLGRVEVDELLADLDHLDDDPAQQRARATPFSGTWLSPPRARDLSLLAREYLRAGYAEDAEPLLRAELENRGGSEARSLLAAALSLLGQDEEAEKLYRQALAANPGSVRTHYNLGQLLVAGGRHRDAVGHFEAALRIDPGNPNAQLANAEALKRTGRAVRALDHYRRALELKPGWGLAANALIRQLAAGADPRVRDIPAAVMLAQHICRTTNFSVAELMDTLAIAYAAAGRFDEAVETSRRALELAADRPDHASEIQARLELFENRQAWTEPY